MAALEKALSINPIPLLQFAATQDFTAENIIFLMQVRRWHAEWDRFVKSDNGITVSTESHLSNIALRIYASSISDSTAEFPVNIGGRVRFALDAVFGPANSVARPSSAGSNVDSFELESSMTSKSAANALKRVSSVGSSTSILGRQGLSSTSSLSSSSSPQLGTVIYDDPSTTKPQDNTPRYFDQPLSRGLFDDAEASIKYLVLTNTWQRFVKAHDRVEVR